MKISSWGTAPAPATDSSSTWAAAVSSQDTTGSNDFGATLASLDGQAAEHAQDEPPQGSSAKTPRRPADDATADTSGQAVRDQTAGAGQAPQPGGAPQPYAPTIIRLLSRVATPIPLANPKSSPAGAASPSSANLTALSGKSTGKSPAAPTTESPDASALGSDSADTSSTSPATAIAAPVPADLLTLLTSAVVPSSTATSTRSSGPSAPRRDAALAATGKAAAATQTGGLASADDIAASDSPALAISHIAIASQIAPLTTLPAGTRASAAVDPKSVGDVKVEGAVSDAPTVGAKPIDATASAGPTVGTPLVPLAPSTAVPIMNAVAGAVLDLANSPSAPSNAADIPDAPGGPAPAPARTMTLQLNPENLGTVTVRMHVTGSSLDVDLTVSDPQTLGLISREHDALAGALRDQSYDLNSLVVQGAGAAATHLGDQNAQSQGSGAQGSGAQGFGGGNSQPSTERQSSGGNGSSGQQASSNREQRDGRPSPDTPAERNAGLLFV